MRNRGPILKVPGAFAREEKGAAFKTISFLERIPENEPGANVSDHLSEEKDDPAQVPHRQGDQ